MNKTFMKCLLLASLGGFIQPALAQKFPDRTIRWIVPWPAGGGADLVARVVVQKVSEDLGQTVFIENRGGAGGNIGASVGAQAAPDGYTITFAYSGTHSINPHLYKSMPFKASDFAPVIFLASVPQLLAVNANVPVHSVKELIALAKSKPGELKFGSSGNGAINHLAGVLFNSMAGVDIQHIPYKGGGPASMALLANEVNMIFGEPATMVSSIKAGKLRPIAMTSKEHGSFMPELPTISETLPGYDVTSWTGVLVPAATPAPIIARLNLAFNNALKDPEVKRRMLEMGDDPIGGKPEAFSQQIQSETAKWGPIVKKTGLQID